MEGSDDTTLGESVKVDTDNDIESAAVSLYGACLFTPASRLRAAATMQWARNDLEMTMPTELNLDDKLSADVDTFRLLVRAQYEHDFSFLDDKLTLTPFAGVAYTRLETDGYTSKFGSKTAFHTQRATQDIYSLTAGLKGSVSFRLGEDSYLTTRTEIFVLQNFGDTEVTNRVRGEGLVSQDTVHPEVIAKTAFGGGLGAELKVSDSTFFSLDYSYYGSSQNDNHALTGNVTYRF